MADKYQPTDDSLRSSNRRLQVRMLATDILRNTPGIMTLAEAMAEAERIISCKSQE